MNSASVSAYTVLLDIFSEGRMTAAEFETLYLFMFKNDPGGLDPAVYEALNGLFGHVDAFCSNLSLRQQTLDGIGPEELRRAAQNVRDQLQS